MNVITSIIGKLTALYKREPAATQAAVAAAWAAWIVIDRALIKHTGVLDWPLVIAGLVALYGLLVRAQVIPVVKFTEELPVGAHEATDDTVVIPPAR